MKKVHTSNKNVNVSPTLRQFLLPLLLVTLLLVTFFVWSLVVSASPSGVLSVSFLDVGQGDAIFIEGPNGKQVLIDGGKGRAVLRELGSRMSTNDRSIDVVIATHPDLDHIGGLPEVFARYKIGMFLEPGVRDEGADNTALQNAIKKEKLESILVRSGMRLILGGGAEIEFLFPETDVSFFDTNTASIVARLTYGETEFLLTGDSPKGIEKYLSSRYGELLLSDVLKLGHHGSDTSTSEQFVGFVSPKYGVISAGCDNSYGHPHKEVVTRLKQFEIISASTCDEGTIVFISDGISVRKK